MNSSFIDLAAILITVSAVFAYINHRFIGLPTTIGVMVVALLASVLVYLAGLLGLADFQIHATALLSKVDFNKALLHGMLSFLLFAGALHVNLHDLKKQAWVILSLATVGVIMSTFLVGTIAYYLLAVLNCHLPYLYCLLFGALISPTDPIAVMATVKRLGVSKELETTIAGESLFNDGVGVVVFMVLLILLQQPESITPVYVATLLAEEALGGLLFGIALGLLGHYLLRSIDNYKVEVLLSLAIVMGGFSLATALHVSAPIAIVIAGLITGNVLRSELLSDQTRRSLNDFWELIDEILNVVLFALIGLEVLIIPFEGQWLLAGVMLIFVVLAVRFFSVGVPIKLIDWVTTRRLAPNLVKILTWGGLRGGISVALALSLPIGEDRDLVLVLTYVIVLFSIVVQGLTIGPLIKRLN